MNSLKENKALIAQTAIDYDMEECDVKRILSMCPDAFYAELENFITDRAKQDY